MESANETSLPTVRELLFEAVLAAATLTLWPILDERSQGTASQRSRAMVYFPIVGFVLGVILAITDRAAGLVAGPMARSVISLIVGAALSLGLANRGVADTVEVLRRGARPASTGLTRIGPVGASAAIVAFTFEVWCLSRISDDAGRAGALVMAMMLSRWAIIPIGYGLRPLEHWGLGIPYEGGISFREFAVSSVIALGLTMGLYQNVGLAVIVALALTILAMRLVLSRRMGGASGYMLAGGWALAEVVTFAGLAAVRALPLRLRASDQTVFSSSRSSSREPLFSITRVACFARSSSDNCARMRASVSAGFSPRWLSIRATTCSRDARTSQISSNSGCQFASIRIAASTTIGSFAPPVRNSATLLRMLSKVAGHTIDVSWLSRSGFPNTIEPSFLRSIVRSAATTCAPNAAITAS